MVLGDDSQQLGPSLLILERFFFFGVGLGLDVKWVGLAKSFGPTGNIERVYDKFGIL